MRIVEDLYVIVTDLQKDVVLFGSDVACAAVAVSQPIKLLHHCQVHLDFDDICKLMYMAIGIEICNQHMLDVCNRCCLRQSHH